MPKFCPVCQGQKRIRLPLHEELGTYDPDIATMTSVPRAQFEEFDCPKCVRSVPYRRVRAKKVIAGVDAGDFAKFQMPMQRRLAAQFGEYLMREGLIWFTTETVDDPRTFKDKMIEVIARCNVVDRAGGELSGAEGRMEIAEAQAEIPQTIVNQIARRKRGLSLREVNIFPVDEPEVVFKPEAEVPRRPKRARDILRMEREKAEAMGNRFSGLELDGGDDD